MILKLKKLPRIKIARPLASNTSTEKLEQKEKKNKYSGMPVVSIHLHPGNLNNKESYYVVIFGNKSFSLRLWIWVSTRLFAVGQVPMYMVLQDKLISGRRITRDTTRNYLSLNFILYMPTLHRKAFYKSAGQGASHTSHASHARHSTKINFHFKLTPCTVMITSL